MLYASVSQKNLTITMSKTHPLLCINAMIPAVAIILECFDEVSFQGQASYLCYLGAFVRLWLAVYFILFHFMQSSIQVKLDVDSRYKTSNRDSVLCSG